MTRSNFADAGFRKKIRVVLVDDHEIFRQALRSLLEKDPDIEVVGEAGDGQTALEIVVAAGAEVVCMDIAMPRMDGIEATRRLLSLNPALVVVGLSSNCDRDFALRLLKAGASGYVTKSASSEELARAIRSGRDGRKYLCREIADAVTESLLQGEGQTAAVRLGARERQVLRLVAEGHTSKQIGERLNISLSTVEVHRRNIMRKLQLHNVVELTKYALRNGITTTDA